MNLNCINPPPSQLYPAVSVIIPMFNAEKYVAECLDSLLNQTFQNFEVIVVDDCSTDNSVAIVKSYVEKLGGRLIFSSLEKNSGSGALPRNKGLMFSRGEYIFFMDADDLLMQNGLEEMYTLAENFNADFVHYENFYATDSEMKNIQLYNQKSGIVGKPTLETENLAERIQAFWNNQYFVTPWCKFVKRNLLIEHEIFFPHICPSEDDIWTLGLIFYAKRILRVPNAIYFLRFSAESVSNTKRTPQQTINFWVNPLIYGLKSLDKLMSSCEFFKANSNYRYDVLEHFIKVRFLNLFDESLSLMPFAIYEAIKEEFGKNLGEHDVLISALCTYINTQEKIATINQQRFNEFAAQAQQRIADLEKINREDKAYISELENYINELNRKEG